MFATEFFSNPDKYEPAVCIVEYLSQGRKNPHEIKYKLGDIDDFIRVIPPEIDFTIEDE